MFSILCDAGVVIDDSGPSDSIFPLMYRVPVDVRMREDEGKNDARRIKNRETPFCLLDCKGILNPITLNPRPGNY